MMKYLYENQFSFYAYNYGIRPADRIIEPIFQTGISKHHAIYLGVDDNGIEWISENQKFAGVRLVKAIDYFQPTKQYQVRKFIGSDNDRVTAVKRALEPIGHPYDLILHNCEHYASYVQTGKAESSRVSNGLLLAGGLLLIGIFAANS